MYMSSTLAVSVPFLTCMNARQEAFQLVPEVFRGYRKTSKCWRNLKCRGWQDFSRSGLVSWGVFFFRQDKSVCQHPILPSLQLGIQAQLKLFIPIAFKAICRLCYLSDKSEDRTAASCGTFGS